MAKRQRDGTIVRPNKRPPPPLQTENCKRTRKYEHWHHAQLTRQEKAAYMAAIMAVYGIRHGEAWHNILFNTLGLAAYTKFEDSTLTVRGMTQAVKGRGQVVPDLVYVSPLTRTLQTATLMFPDTPIIAVDCLKEYPQHVQIINRRTTKSKLELLFPTVDFSHILLEEDCLFNSGPPLETLKVQRIVARQLLKESFLKESPPQTIVFVTHSSWLKYFMYGDVGDEHDELEHCTPYEITL